MMCLAPFPRRFVMCPPEHYAIRVANNALMRDLERRSPRGLVVDGERAWEEWSALYRAMAELGIVYLLPPVAGLQDQIFCANVAVRLPGTQQVVLSRFKAEGRAGEEAPAARFFEELGLEVHASSEPFEGEADLKHVRGQLYAGACGMRTSKAALDAFAARFDLEIVPVELTNERLFHLDCVLLPLSQEAILLNESGTTRASVRRLEARFEVERVPPELMEHGATNAIVAGDTLVLGTGSGGEAVQRRLLEFMGALCAKHALRLVCVGVSEFEKSGAAASCLVMHL